MPDKKHRLPVVAGPSCAWHGGHRDPAVIRWVVVHDTEGSAKQYPAQPSAAAIARWGASSGAVGRASWHWTVDQKERIRCLHDDVVSYTAYSPANDWGIHIEICGWARWTRLHWYRHQATLKRAAWIAAEACVRYGLPARWVTDHMLKTGARGLTTHAQITRALKKGTHTDPGKGFPSRYFLFLVRRRVKWIKADA